MWLLRCRGVGSTPTSCTKAHIMFGFSGASYKFENADGRRNRLHRTVARYMVHGGNAEKRRMTARIDAPLLGRTHP